jgi:hypothetical protein
VQYDAFISHASEDKDELVRALAEQLRLERVEVWYDEFSLRVGDSLRRSIDKGLAQSRYGIVILSPAFFEKQWGEWELDGLVARQNSGDRALILPIWHGVTRDEVMEYSPSLAGRLAIDSEVGLHEIVRKLLEVVRPQGSTLAIARDHLLHWGSSPPVISDDWWLDVAASAESNDGEGGWQEAMGWGRWGFPLPPSDREPAARGWRMAWAAMQMQWQLEANERPITQITNPMVVHEFISSQPGLAATSADHVRYLIAYAPQLTIPGYGGEFEPAIESLYRASMDRAGRRSPGCDEEYALRDPDFGHSDAANLACGFVQGNYVANGPPVKFYSYIEYVAWLLSEQSKWLPEVTRAMLTRGMAEWGVWPWARGDAMSEDFGFEPDEFTGEFSSLLWETEAHESFVMSRDARKDVVHRLDFSSRLLALPEDGEILAQRLLAPEFLGLYFDKRAQRKKKR